MIRIALLGQIGSGKTFVSKCFRYPLFNADEIVTRPDPDPISNTFVPSEIFP